MPQEFIHRGSDFTFKNQPSELWDSYKFLTISKIE